MAFWSRAIVLVACASVLCACNGSGATSPTPADRLASAGASANIDFFAASGDTVDPARQQIFHDWAIVQLGVAPSARLRYSKYRDRAHLTRMTNRVTNGFAEPSVAAVHSIFPFDPHEAIHIYTELIGRPSDFFNEGIAVAMAVDPSQGQFVSLWGNTPIDVAALNLLRAGLLPSLNSVAESQAFRRIADSISYPAAGSFVGFLLRERGMPAMRDFFRTGTRDDNLSVIQVRFRTAFGWQLPEAEVLWRTALTSSP
jgi:hypothetical protein